jgi:hypothetical protein
MKPVYTLLIIGLLFLPTQVWAVGTPTPAASDASLMVSERAVESSTAVMVNANTVFTITGGPIQILELLSVCVTANDATASTMQWQSVPTVGSAQTFSGASASLASVTAGSTYLLTPTALTTAPTPITAAAGGVQLGANLANRIIVKDGTIKLVIGVGSTTGTWKHYLRYRPLAPSATVN